MLGVPLDTLEAKFIRRIRVHDGLGVAFVQRGSISAHILLRQRASDESSEAPSLSAKPDPGERAVVQRFLDLMAPLDDAERLRILRTVATYFDLNVGGSSSHGVGQMSSPIGAARAADRAPLFSGHEPISPKEFLRQKEPKTDVERAMCLAYYLAHYKDAPHFKTADIAKLNTEAAQRKFANTAYTINNAATTGYFVAGVKAHKQLSSMGEQYVEALPDRVAAKAVVERSRPRKTRQTPKRK